MHVGRVAAEKHPARLIGVGLAHGDVEGVVLADDSAFGPEDLADMRSGVSWTPRASACGPTGMMKPMVAARCRLGHMAVIGREGPIGDFGVGDAPEAASRV